MNKRVKGQGSPDVVVRGVYVFIAVTIVGTAVYAWHKHGTTKAATTKQISAATQAEQKTVPQNSVPPTSNATQTTGTTGKTLIKGDFGDKGNYGTTQIEGYPTTVQVNEDVACQTNCKKAEYIFFSISRTESAKLLNYIKNLSGNAYVQDKAIGIGCLANSQISYYNANDAKGSVQYTISRADTVAIMAATQAKPVVLSVQRLPLSTGKDAPACYSHFMTFSIIK